MAITAATFQAYERVGPDRYRVQLELTRNDGPATKEWFDAQGLTLADIRLDLRNKLAERVEREGMRDVLTGITVGTAIPITRPTVTPTTPTAKEVWLEKVSRYQRFREVGLTGGGATALTTLLADINATYQAGFLDA